MQLILDLLAAEIREPSPGGEAVTTRLADILVVQAIRWWITNEPASGRGILAALRDPQIGRALLAFQRDPGRPWTVASLAGEAAISRSSFAERFTAIVGEPAMRFVARFRMQLARARLHSDNPPPLAELALELGYGSEAAFSRAFKTHAGCSPSDARRNHT